MSKPYLFLFLNFIFISSLSAENWSHYRGNSLNGFSKDEVFINALNKHEPKLKWKVKIKTGYSSLVINNKYAYTMGNESDTDYVYCLNKDNGKIVWEFSYKSALNPKLYKGGPNATPTLDGDKLYTAGREGQIYCFDAKTGKVIWATDLKQELKLQFATWGVSSAPLIFENKVYLNAGTNGVCLDKKTGKIIWSSGKKKTGYAAAYPFKIKGKTAIAIFNAKSLCAVDPNTGKLFWKLKWRTKYDINATIPQQIEDDKLFISSAYGKGGGLIQFTESSAKIVWETKEFALQFNPAIYHDGHLYGGHGNTGKKSDLRCVNAKTGEVAWSDTSIGFASVIAAGDYLIILNEKGHLFIAQLTSKELKIISKRKVLDGQCWSTPSIANGLLYARSAEGEVVCYSLSP